MVNNKIIVVTFNTSFMLQIVERWRKNRSENLNKYFIQISNICV